jgi:Glycosyltransferase like family
VATIYAITFAAAVNNRALLDANLLMSPCFRGVHGHQILVQENFPSAAMAYNDAIAKSVNELIVFCHQDIVFPNYWLPQLDAAVIWLKANDPTWGVLGCYGKSSEGRGWGHLYSSGRGVMGGPLDRPVRVQTLDETVLIIKRSSGLRFNEYLPNFHLYGADICLEAAERGMGSYVIPGFCIHNTQQNLLLPREFYECCSKVRKVWKKRLPIHTPTITITRYNMAVYGRRLKEACLYLRRKRIGASRANDVRPLLAHFSVRPQEFSIGSGLSLWTRAQLYLRRRLIKGADKVASDRDT